MATFGLGSRKEDRQAWLRASVGIDSAFGWKRDVLVQNLCAGLDISQGWGFVEVEHTPYETHHVYMIRWKFDLGYDGVPNENEERLQRDAEHILAVFNEMEEKVKAVKAIEDPLEWLLEDDGGDDEDDALLAAYLQGCAEGQRVARAESGSP